MTKTRMVLMLIGLLAGVGYGAEPVGPQSRPSLSESEKQEGWTLLFDGVSTKGWRGLGMETFPADIWLIQDGCLHCVGGAKPNDLVTIKEYENFELTFEWMIPKVKGNSGLKYRVQEQKGHGFAFGPEYQCMEDPGVVDKHATGSLYDLLPPEGKKLAPQGQFNQSRIVSRGNHVEHWLNGVKVVEFDFGSDALNAAISKSKFKNTDWGKKAMGHIVLQDHHDEAFFRNLKIRELSADGGK